MENSKKRFIARAKDFRIIIEEYETLYDEEKGTLQAREVDGEKARGETFILTEESYPTPFAASAALRGRLMVLRNKLNEDLHRINRKIGMCREYATKEGP